MTAASAPATRDSVRFDEALLRFDEENARDTNAEVEESTAQPRELLYARRLFGWVLKLAPNASEELRLAARCQHICRWQIPRSSYPMTRTGYLKWRNDLKAFHATKAGEILRQVGYPDEVIARVQDLNLKKNFPADPEARVLEDALCLVFLEFQFGEFAAKTEEPKVISILQKTWKKITPTAQSCALNLPFSERERVLIQRALAQE
ncbi:MAG: DUF4202 domain-containing protein [Verrucomicrobiota bacterium]